MAKQTPKNAADLAGLGMPWDHAGRHHILACPDLMLELEFQRRHQAATRRRLEGLRSMIGEAAYAEDIDGYQRQVAENAFAFGGGLSVRYLLTPEGMEEYLWLLMERGTRDGGQPIARKAVEKIRREEPETWKEVTDRVIRRDFPFLVSGPPSASTSASSPPSPESPGTTPGEKSSL